MLMMNKYGNCVKDVKPNEIEFHKKLGYKEYFVAKPKETEKPKENNKPKTAKKKVVKNGK